MRRRGPFSGLFSLFLFIIMLDIFSFALDLIDIFLPLISFTIFGYGIYKIIESFSGKNKKNYKYKNTTTNNNYKHSNAISSKNNKIDKALSDYYKNNISLEIFDNVSLSTQSGTYTTVDNLYINYFDEKICQLKEYKASYPEGYNRIINYLNSISKKDLKNLVKESKERKNKKDEKKEKENDSGSPAIQYIDQINSLNNNLFNEEVTNGLYQTCELLKQIDIVDMEDGSVDPKLNKLYEYYLPILIDILSNYKKLSESAIKGDEFKKCELQLVKTIKLINEALKTIYNSLKEIEYMNLNADISTLQSLLKQDGYGSTPFKEK